jgi:hypothetical protein
MTVRNWRTIETLSKMAEELAQLPQLAPEDFFGRSGSGRGGL